MEQTFHKSWDPELRSKQRVSGQHTEPGMQHAMFKIKEHWRSSKAHSRTMLLIIEISGAAVWVPAPALLEDLNVIRDVVLDCNSREPAVGRLHSIVKHDMMSKGSQFCAKEAAMRTSLPASQPQPGDAPGANDQSHNQPISPLRAGDSGTTPAAAAKILKSLCRPHAICAQACS